MKRSRETGIATVWMVVFMCIAVVGAATTTYFWKKASDHARAQETAAKQAAPNDQQTEIKDVTETPVAAQPKTETPTPQPAAPTCALDTTMYVVVKEGHALRSDKSLTATKVVTAPYGAELKVGCKDGAWYKANYAGKEAYAYAEYLSATKPAAETAAKSDMTQDKCTTVTTLYTTKDPTPIYVLVDGKVVSGNQSVPKGTALKGGECAKWQGSTVKGYWLLNATLYSFSDLSTTKP